MVKATPSLGPRAGATAYVTVCVPKLARIRTVSNCSQEIPVYIGNSSAYADPLTFILQPFPTTIPCDSITPVRWRISGHWMCSSPALSSCVAPMQLDPTTDDSVVLQDFTLGLGGGIFSAAQRAAHALFLTLTIMNTREPVVSDIIQNAIAHAGMSGKLQSFYSEHDLERLRDEIGSALIPFFDLMGDRWSIITGCFFVFALVKICIGMSIRMYTTYIHRGCGWWILASVWHTAFLAVMLPWRILRSLTVEMTNPLPPTPEVSNQPTTEPEPNGGSGSSPNNPGSGGSAEPPDDPFRMMNRNDSQDDLPKMDRVSQLTRYLQNPRSLRRSNAEQRYQDLTTQLAEMKKSMERTLASGLPSAGSSDDLTPPPDFRSIGAPPPPPSSPSATAPPS